MKLPHCLAPGLLVFIGAVAYGQIYTPDQVFQFSRSAVGLYDQFSVNAPVLSSTGTNNQAIVTTPGQSALSMTPLSDSLSTSNSGSFSSFVGPISATESVSASASANFGLLSSSGTATVTSQFSTASWGNLNVAVAGQPQVQFQDHITITPTATLLAGTSVNVRITEAFSKSQFTESGTSLGNYGELVGVLSMDDQQANDATYYFGQSFNMSSNRTPQLYYPLNSMPNSATYGSTTSVTANVTMLAGTTYWFSAGLFNGAQAGQSSDDQQGASNSVSLSATAYTLINLPQNITYTTGSGTQYLTRLPATAAVPDSGTTLLLLAIGIAGLATAAAASHAVGRETIPVR